MKRRVLPNSSRSAPLAGGRFRRPAKTHAGTPSGAHFSHHLQVWRPAGGAVAAPGRRLRVRGPPCVTGCGRVGLICVRRLRRVTALSAGAVAHLRRDIADGRRTSMPDPAGPVARVTPDASGGAGRYPIPCDYKVCSCGWLRHRPGGVGVRSEHLSEHHEGHGAVDVVGPVALSGARPAVGTKECTQIGKNDLSEPFRGIRVHCCAVVDRHGGAGVYTDRRKRLLGNRSEVFVYTVATRRSHELRREPHRVARVPQPPWRAGGAHSVAVAPLVGKTGSARVAPQLGWRLHRGINPH